MCGRYTHLFAWDELHHLSGLVVPAFEAKKSYNVAPTQSAPIIRRQEDGALKIELLRWGLIPSWSKDIKIAASLINARAETVESKPSFRSAFKSRRCLVPVSGFYEWKKSEDPKKKQPYYILAKDEKPLLFAGLWETWSSEQNELHSSFSIITTEVNNYLSEIHDRMPVILQLSEIEKWLSPLSTQNELKSLLKSSEDNLLKYYPVSTIVNKPSNNSEKCIEREN